ncbi:MAG: hypothetical protein KBG82_00785 [Spirochaetes bacterium]|nr:hypothetical protein [Spirochaetota bacterium]
MKKLLKESLMLLILVLFLCFFFDSNILAQESLKGNYLIVGPNLLFSMMSWNISLDLTYLYYFSGWFGLGLGTNLYYSITNQDLYISAYLRFAIRRLYLEGGVGYNIIPTTLPDMITIEQGELLPWVAIRADLIQTETQAGAWNLHLFFGFYITAMKMIDINDEGLNFIQEIIANLIVQGVGLVMNGFKVGIGVTYTFYLNY